MLQELCNCITIILVRFTWDPQKAAANARKHGVSFEEAREEAL